MKHFLLSALLLAGLASCGGEKGPDGCWVSGPDEQTTATSGEPEHTVTYTVKQFSFQPEGWQFLREVAGSYIARSHENGTYHIVFLDARSEQAIYGENLRINNDVLGLRDVTAQ